MTMRPQPLPWMHPLDLASAIDDPCRAFLYSGIATSYSGRYSYLACDLAERVEGKDFAPLAKKLSANRHPFDNAWFGYLGYGLKDALESLPPDPPGDIALPNLCMMRFHTIYQFDHAEKKLTAWSEKNITAPPKAKHRAAIVPEISDLASNMSKTAYLEKAAHVIERIHAGDLYQANLTRKFSGEFAEKPDAFALFRQLCGISPAPYSAYLAIDGTHILSSSPELFLHIGADGNVRARPIKGTAARFDDAADDLRSKRLLEDSAKDRAENLMIVDLMRNDLARSCVAGSIETREMFEVTTHATIHHMSSTVAGQKSEQATALDTVRHCFPPGSMTGAPKIKAMQLCSEMENRARGVYSGAIGWFGGDGSCELSVVIRTLILQQKRFEFQVGGGIVADSTPQGELKELIDKSKGLLACLGIPAEHLERL